MTIRRVEAKDYLGRAESGRSMPLKVDCVDRDGELVQAYVKYIGFHDQLLSEHLVCELVANLYALDLNIPAAEPLLVDLNPDFIERVLPESVRAVIQVASISEPVVAFGSKAFSPVKQWAEVNLVKKRQKDSAAALYMFDSLVENTDRGIGNPNLLVSGGDFKVIDFGHCFQRCHEEIHDEKPWEKYGIKNVSQGRMQHVLYRQLKGKVSVEAFDAFRASLLGLEDDTIQGYVNEVPTEWGQDTACNIVDFLLEARENADKFISEVKEALNDTQVKI